MNSKGRPRTLNHEEVLVFIRSNPTLTQGEIAKHFSVAQSHVCRIMHAAGMTTENHGGIPPKRRRGQTEEEHYWETLLCRAGLGMDRGLRVAGKRIFYGHSDKFLRVKTFSDTEPIFRGRAA